MPLAIPRILPMSMSSKDFSAAIWLASMVGATVFAGRARLLGRVGRLLGGIVANMLADGEAVH
jgi:hypothetical protein